MDRLIQNNNWVKASVSLILIIGLGLIQETEGWWKHSFPGPYSDYQRWNLRTWVELRIQNKVPIPLIFHPNARYSSYKGRWTNQGFLIAREVHAQRMKEVGPMRYEKLSGRQKKFEWHKRRNEIEIKYEAYRVRWWRLYLHVKDVHSKEAKEEAKRNIDELMRMAENHLAPPIDFQGLEGLSETEFNQSREAFVKFVSKDRRKQGWLPRRAGFPETPEPKNIEEENEISRRYEFRARLLQVRDELAEWVEGRRSLVWAAQENGWIKREHPKSEIITKYLRRHGARPFSINDPVMLQRYRQGEMYGEFPAEFSRFRNMDYQKKEVKEGKDIVQEWQFETELDTLFATRIGEIRDRQGKHMGKSKPILNRIAEEKIRLELVPRYKAFIPFHKWARFLKSEYLYEHVQIHPKFGNLDRKVPRNMTVQEITELALDRNRRDEQYASGIKVRNKPEIETALLREAIDNKREEDGHYWLMMSEHEKSNEKAVREKLFEAELTKPRQLRITELDRHRVSFVPKFRLWEMVSPPTPGLEPPIRLDHHYGRWKRSSGRQLLSLDQSGRTPAILDKIRRNSTGTSRKGEHAWGAPDEGERIAAVASTSNGAESNVLNAVTNGNKLIPGLGMNYKYKGELYNNLDRIQVVVIVKMPRFEWGEANWLKDIDVHHVCETEAWKQEESLWTEAIHKGEQNGGGRATQLSKRDLIRLQSMCAVFKQHIDVLRDRERELQRTVGQELVKEMASLFPSLSGVLQGPWTLDSTWERTKRSIEEGKVRTKRFVGWILSVIKGGFDIAKSVWTYLQVKKVSKRVDEIDERLHRLDESFVTYQKVMLNVVEGIHKTQEKHDKLIRENRLGIYNNLRQIAGLDMWTAFLTNMIHFTNYLEQKVTIILEEVKDQMERLVRGLSTMATGRLSPDVVNATQLKEIIQNSLDEITKDYPDYKPAITQTNSYYDMKLASLYYDPQKDDILISFPIFITPMKNTPFRLYEIETAHVPILDENTRANSYTRVLIEKPYIAVNDEHYIQLTTPELESCQFVDNRWYCEERFLVKHNSRFTCESAVFQHLPEDKIERLCTIEYAYNKTVPPSILDGGDQIVLANMRGDKFLRCNNNIARKPLPDAKSTYLIINKEVLCNCDVETDLTVLQKTISSCDGGEGTITTPVHYITNHAFLYQLNKLREYEKKFEPIKLNLTDLPQVLPIQLHEAPSLAEQPKRLTELRESLESQEKWVREHPRQDKVWNDSFWSSTWVLVIDFIGAIIAAFLFGATCYLCVKQKYYYALLSAPLKAVAEGAELGRQVYQPEAAALDPPSNDPSDQCEYTWVSWLVFVTSILGAIWCLIRFKAAIVDPICKGKTFNLQGKLHLVMCNEKYRISLPLCNVFGPYHTFGITTEITDASINLVEKFWYDKVIIVWNGVQIYTQGKVLRVPTQFMVPFFKRWQLRRILRPRRNNLMVALCLEQGGFRYHLPMRSQIEAVSATPRLRIRRPSVEDERGIEMVDLADSGEVSDYESDSEQIITPMFKHYINLLPSGHGSTL